MKEKTVTIGLTDGLDAGVIAVLVQRACKFSSSVYLQAEGKKVNAKSIMGMMNMGVNKGKEITIVADGEDEDTAISELEEYLTTGK
ncbi:MAG: HPr family phosphocarrier protein [Lachnospiraceae bacterium]|nr:HPr family phosphocarrier protein [Lachnospiraceae bacterium]MBQ8041685.1 HPr family phosphocarrier protein [Lachnospiraceae bacterium]MBQ8261275.1 HPr family phosphocarrier protein [Lachnospiraceae bacterium]MBQ8263085.1 HPr family phosphocarrier protein [Lachnospiraceae bacterium]